MDTELKNYLNKNHSLIEIEDKYFESLSILDRELIGREIFLAGENHGIKANGELRMKFLKYFKEKTNFKYYLCELPYSLTSTLNRYLQTGDEKILEDVYTILKGTDAWNKDEYNHWKELYEFNTRFSQKDKIVPIGIDIEHQPKNAFEFMDYVLDKKNIPESIKKDVKVIKDKEEVSYEEIKTFNKKIDEELVSRKEHYKKILKEDYLDIIFVNDNLLNMVEVYSSNNFDGRRDEKMGKNFIKLFSRLDKSKYYGQVGLSHIFQRSFPYVDWLASFLNSEESGFKNKLLSIAYAYKDSKYLYPTNRKNYVGDIDTLEPSIEEFESFVDDGYTLFKLDQEGSPFGEKLIWPLKHKNPLEGVTTDYFQYLIVIRGSEEMEGF